MLSQSYALRVFRSHFESANIRFDSTGYSALELGPGDSLFSALTANAYGASSCILVDEGSYAIADLKAYREMAGILAAEGLHVPSISHARTVSDVLLACNARYLTEGLVSLRGLPDSSIDFLWSNAVLEHVRRSDFVDLNREIRRILKPEGVVSHQVDLRDHLGGALNNLRYSAETWESDEMSHSGFYTNRIRFQEMLSIFDTAGFDVEVDHKDQWSALPTPRSKMQPEFAALDNSNLLVMGFSVLLKPKRAGVPLQR